LPLAGEGTPATTAVVARPGDRHIRPREFAIRRARLAAAHRRCIRAGGCRRFGRYLVARRSEKGLGKVGGLPASCHIRGNDIDSVAVRD